MFNVCIKDWSYPITNPVKQIYKPHSSGSRKRRLTSYEYNYLLHNNSINPKLKSIIALAIETGMRRGEILQIHPHNIKDRILVLPMTKNGSSRQIPLTKKAIRILNDSKLPFETTPNAVRLAWSRLKKKGNIKDLHFHDLRHEAISRFFEKGLSIPEVALISGHKDVRMLFRYTHLKAEDILRKL
jgi:integrase